MKKTFLQSSLMMMVIAFALLACSKYPGFKQTDTGLYYKIEKISKDTAKPKTGDWVSMDYRITAVSKGKDTLVFDSKKAGQSPFRIQIPDAKSNMPIFEAVKMLSKGDSGSFIIKADSFFVKLGGMKPPYVDSNSMIRFFVYLVDVQNPAAMMQKEDSDRKSYLQSNNITAAPLPSGVYYIETLAGTGMRIDTTRYIKLNYAVTLLSGKELFSTKQFPETPTVKYGQSFDTPGFTEAVGLMSKGGKANIIVPSAQAFGDKGMGSLVPPYSTLVYNVEVLDVLTKAAYDKEQVEKKKTEAKKQAEAQKGEISQIEKYMKDNNLKGKKLNDGLYYVEKVAGTGPKAVSGKNVSVHYTGTLLNGNKFDSSVDRGKPFEFTLGQGQVIKGWDEGITQMKKGGKAILIIPSALGYGPQDKGTIPPNSILVFDVELIDIK